MSWVATADGWKEEPGVGFGLGMGAGMIKKQPDDETREQRLDQAREADRIALADYRTALAKAILGCYDRWDRPINLSPDAMRELVTAVARVPSPAATEAARLRGEIAALVAQRDVYRQRGIDADERNTRNMTDLVKQFDEQAWELADLRARLARAEREAMRTADKWKAVADEWARWYIATQDAPPERIVVLPEDWRRRIHDVLTNGETIISCTATGLQVEMDGSAAAVADLIESWRGVATQPAEPASGGSGG